MNGALALLERLVPERIVAVGRWVRLSWTKSDALPVAAITVATVADLAAWLGIVPALLLALPLAAVMILGWALATRFIARLTLCFIRIETDVTRSTAPISLVKAVPNNSEIPD